MAKNLIGYTTCADCGYESAEVGLDKSGNPYRVCLGECEGAQTFSHGKAARVKNMLAKTRPIAGVDLHAIAGKFNVTLPGAPAAEPKKAEPAAEPDQPGAKPDTPPAAKKRPRNLLDELQGAAK